MGDTGSFALGGALGAFALMMNVELLLLLIGGIFVIEALSVIIQVFTFKYLGRRVFLMAPIHHHFEMKAWSETKIMVRFWIVTGILCAAGVRALLPLLLRVPPGPPAVTLPGSALVLGLARSGQAARRRARAARRARRRRRPRARKRRRRLASRRDGAARQEPRRAGRGGARRRGSPPRDPRLERARARLPHPREPARRGDRDERQDDDERAARRDARRAGRGQRRRRALRARRRRRAGLVGRRRGVELPARGHRHVSGRASPSCSTSSRTTSTATVRSSRTRPRSSASSRTRSSGTSRSSRAASARFPAKLAAPTSTADDPLPAEPLIPGAHNRENAAAATVAARAAGATEEEIARALREFPGVPHRLEPVAERDGVLFVNDSKATNVAAALRALAAYDRPLLLIAGGAGKGESVRAARRSGAREGRARVPDRRGGARARRGAR